MTLADIRELYSYNAWAMNRIFDAVAQIPADLYMRDLKSSHGGVHGTLTHLVAAEKIWLSRWTGHPEKTLLQAREVPALRDLKTIWEHVNTERERFLDTLTESSLGDKFSMTTTKGDRYVHTYAQMMQHLVNHSSYHRGQVASLMRQLGCVPHSTDLIAYYRRGQHQPA